MLPMKTITLFMVALSITGAACAQEPAPQATNVLRYQQCPWQDVLVVPTGDSAAAHTTTVGFFSLPKTGTRRTFADLTDTDLKQVKKAAKRAHTCLVTVDDDYHTPKQIKNPDLKKEAELNTRILFYFMAPIATIDQAGNLPPYHKRDREKWQAARGAK